MRGKLLVILIGFILILAGCMYQSKEKSADSSYFIEDTIMMESELSIEMIDEMILDTSSDYAEFPNYVKKEDLETQWERDFRKEESEEKIFQEDSIWASSRYEEAIRMEMEQKKQDSLRLLELQRYEEELSRKQRAEKQNLEFEQRQKSVDRQINNLELQQRQVDSLLKKKEAIK